MIINWEIFIRYVSYLGGRKDNAVKLLMYSDVE